MKPSFLRFIKDRIPDPKKANSQMKKNECAGPQMQSHLDESTTA
jgi:hypothetical protein